MAAPSPSLRAELVRSLGTAERRAVAELSRIAEDANGYPSLSEQALLDLDLDLDLEPEPEAGTGARALLVRRDGDAAPALRAAGVLRQGARGQWTLELLVDPSAAEGPEGLALDAALLGGARAEVAQEGGGSLHVWLRGDAPARAAAMATAGFAPVRQLLQLGMPLPVTPGRRGRDPSLPVRPFHPGRDEEAWLAVNRRAFADHPEQGQWTLADLERRERAPWFDPGGFLLHEVDRRIAGFCWTKVHRAPVVGEIYVIGVDPDFQGRGLGRSLTLAGLDHLAARGVPDAMLYVEAANVAATALYRSLGFTELHRETLFGADVEPGGHSA